VSREESKTQRVRKSLTDAGLVEINLDEFPARIKEVKHLAMGRLGELLQLETSIQERQSVARSLGTLKRLEGTLRSKPHEPTSEEIPAPARTPNLE
jgi:hypothetical protein